MKGTSRGDSALTGKAPSEARTRYRFPKPDSPEGRDMKDASRHMVRHANLVARDIDARAVLVLADAIEGDDELTQLVRTVKYRTILISRSPDRAPLAIGPNCEWITVPDVHMTRTGQVKVALLVCLAKGLVQGGDRVVCLTGIDQSSMRAALLLPSEKPITWRGASQRASRATRGTKSGVARTTASRRMRRRRHSIARRAPSTGSAPSPPTRCLSLV